MYAVELTKESLRSNSVGPLGKGKKYPLKKCYKYSSPLILSHEIPNYNFSLSLYLISSTRVILKVLTNEVLYSH